jgi:hypothetical protein
MIVYGVKCKLCRDTIYSRARHDFRYCSCGNVFVDGGQYDVGRQGLNVKDSFTPAFMNLEEVDKKDLYQDWNGQTDKYGLVHDPDFTNKDRERARLKMKLRFE